MLHQLIFFNLASVQPMFAGLNMVLADKLGHALAKLADVERLFQTHHVTFARTPVVVLIQSTNRFFVEDASVFLFYRLYTE